MGTAVPVCHPSSVRGRDGRILVYLRLLTWLHVK